MNLSYGEFERQLLVGTATIAEEKGDDFISARDVFDRYDIPRKPNWLGRALEGLVSRGWAIDTRTIGSEDDWDIYLNAAGFRAAENLASGLRLPEKEELPNVDADEAAQGSTDDVIADLAEQIAPAADRLVSLKDNQPQRQAMAHELATVRTSLSGSNLLDPDEKADVLVSLQAAEQLINQSDTWLAGSMKYLVFDRVKKAFERTIEDAIRVVVLGALATLAAIILALI